jgi:hypothetical protein
MTTDPALLVVSHADNELFKIWHTQYPFVLSAKLIPVPGCTTLRPTVPMRGQGGQKFVPDQWSLFGQGGSYYPSLGLSSIFIRNIIGKFSTWGAPSGATRGAKRSRETDGIHPLFGCPLQDVIKAVDAKIAANGFSEP